MAGKTIPFRLITPLAVAFEGDAELVIVVGTEGEEGILPSHAPFLTALRPGILRANVADAGGTRRLELATSDGFVQALPDRVSVLVDHALTRDEIDAHDAREEREAALERQRAVAPQSAEWAREQSAIDFANAKLALVHG
ncbi:MAG: ATP synthase F1 subunit epsilon [Vulcanimicrobiaceae bacterium]